MESVASALHTEYERAKQNLKGVDEKFIRLYGHDPLDKRQQRRVSRTGSTGGNSGGHGAAAGRLFGEASRIINNPNREPIGGPVNTERRPGRRVSLGQGPRHLGNIQSRLGPKRRREDSGDEEETSPNRPMLQSAVIIPELKREDSVAMRTDQKGMARNRRMFGALLGTLQSFQKDSKKEENREKRRAEVEKRLEEKQEDEKIKLRHARAALWEERREKQRLLRQLEIKMKMVKAFEDWEETIRHQAHFIKTTSRWRHQHHIFYKPRVMLPANKKALHATEDYVEGVIKDQKRRLEMEIERMMSAPARPGRPSGGRDRRDSDRRDKRDSPRDKQRRQSKGDKSDGSDDSDEHSESEDQATDSEAEDGELTDTRKQIRERENAQANAEDGEAEIVQVKEEKDGKEPAEEGVKVKQEKAEGEVMPSAEQQVSNGKAQVWDEVTNDDDQLTESAAQVSHERSQVSEGEGQDGKSSAVTGDKERKGSPRERREKRDGSSASRSRSPTPNTKPRRKRRSPPKQKAPSKSDDKSGSSSSGSDSRSGSSSGSDLEPESKKHKTTPAD